ATCGIPVGSLACGEPPISSYRCASPPAPERARRAARMTLAAAVAWRRNSSPGCPSTAPTPSASSAMVPMRWPSCRESSSPGRGQPTPGAPSRFDSSPVPEHSLRAPTWTEIASRGRGNLLVVPVGSFEQHGPHLPLDTDTRVATALAAEVASLPFVIVAPPLAYGASGEHAGLAGTL